METLLRLQAAKSGQNITGYLMRLVENDLHINLSEYAGLEDFASSIAAIQAGLEDMEAGRTVSLEEAFAQLKEEHRQYKTMTALR